MKEINEQWIKEEALRTFPNAFISDEPFSHDENSELRTAWRSGANSILPHYNSLKAENERLREALGKIMLMKLDPGETSYNYAFNRCWHIAHDALNDERSVATAADSSNDPDKQSPQ
jgi:hypothetical protein